MAIRGIGSADASDDAYDASSVSNDWEEAKRRGARQEDVVLETAATD